MISHLLVDPQGEAELQDADVVIQIDGLVAFWQDHLADPAPLLQVFPGIKDVVRPCYDGEVTGSQVGAAVG